MNAETIHAIQEALAPIAEKIGQGAEFGWEAVVRQQYIEGIAGLGLSVASLLIVILCVYYMAPYAREDWVNDTGIFAFLVAIIAIPSIVLLGGWAYVALLKLLNPTYYALQFFISLGHQ